MNRYTRGLLGMEQCKDGEWIRYEYVEDLVASYQTYVEQHRQALDVLEKANENTDNLIKYLDRSDLVTLRLWILFLGSLGANIILLLARIV